MRWRYWVTVAIMCLEMIAVYSCLQHVHNSRSLLIRIIYVLVAYAIAETHLRDSLREFIEYRRRGNEKNLG